MNRKHFIRQAGLAATSFAVLPSAGLFAAITGTKLRMAIIGLGLRGQHLLDLLLSRQDVELVAICDTDDRMLVASKEMISKSGKKMPRVFTGDAYSWQKMLEQVKGIDAIVIATRLEWHKPMIMGALERGIKYVGTEVMIGTTLQDHWDVVHAAENSKAQVMMLENLCYRRDVMTVLNMVRQGMFGRLIHLQGGYQYDLRSAKFNDGKQSNGTDIGTGEGRLQADRGKEQSLYRDGDQYPTHGIGPIAHYVNINRGNRFLNLSSFSNRPSDPNDAAVKNVGADLSNAKLNSKLRDVVTTKIRCANGETIMLQNDASMPLPYSQGFRVQGTEGMWMDVDKGIYIGRKTAKKQQWNEATDWQDKYDHPLWARLSKEKAGVGQGGMDFLVMHAFIEAAKRKVPTPMDVYDAAAWSAITPLGEQSIALGNKPVEFPDFTNGEWMNRKPVFALDSNF